MTGPQLRAVLDFEHALLPGLGVVVRWTSGGSAYAGPAAVKTASRKSVRVTLDEPVGTYPAGHEIVAPRIDDIGRWSARNRVEPRGGYPPDL